MAHFSFPYYFTIPNFEFWFPNSEICTTNSGIRNCEVYVMWTNGHRLSTLEGILNLQTKNKRQHDLNCQTYKCFYPPFWCIAMTPCFVISCLINYSKQSSGKMIYVCYWVDYQLNRRKKNSLKIQSSMNYRKFSKKRRWYSQLLICRTLISQNTLVYQRIYSRHIYYLYFNSLYLKLLVSQSKLSWIIKDTLKYKLSELNFDFEVSRVDCRRHKYSFSVYSVDYPLNNTRRSFYRRTALNS